MNYENIVVGLLIAVISFILGYIQGKGQLETD